MRTKMLTTICAAAMFTLSTMADDGHGNNNNNNGSNSSFESSVIGSAPGVPIGGVATGGAPWVVSQGEASISSNGRLRVEVQGLLIGPGGPANLAGTTGPVIMVGATLVCGGTGGTPVSVPDTAISPAPLSSKGNAEIDQMVTLPPACFGPVVLVRVFTSSAPLGSQLGAFIAASGLTPNGQNQNPNGHEDKEGGGHGH